jgi:hypothetical protein
MKLKVLLVAVLAVTAVLVTNFSGKAVTYASSFQIEGYKKCDCKGPRGLFPDFQAAFSGWGAMSAKYVNDNHCRNDPGCKAP